MGLKSDSYRRAQNYVFEVEADDIDSVGYAEISNTGSLGAFTGSAVPALASATYDLDITVDGTIRKLATALLVTDDWDAICSKLETTLQGLTSSTETIAIVDGKIKVTSATNGEDSKILIEAGTTGSGGGDLIAAITAIGATYIATLDTPVDGEEGVVHIPIDVEDLPTLDFASIVSVVTSAGLQKSGLVVTYDKDTGILSIADDGSTTELVVGDMIYITGYFYNEIA